MKKKVLTIAIVLGLTVCSYAQGGLFRRGGDAGDSPDAGYSLNRGGQSADAMPMLPIHEPQGGTNGDEPAAPLGSGIAVLLTLGGAYLVGKRREE